MELRSVRKFFLGAVIALFTIVQLTIGPCGAASELRVGATSDVTNWDPATATSTNDRGPQQCIYQNLVRWDKDLDPVPDLAKSWEISDNGLVWTFPHPPVFLP